MSNNVQLCEFLNGEEKAWDDYVTQAPHSSFGHLSIWKHIIEKTYGHKGWYFWVVEQDKVKGILPLVSMETILFGRLLVSLPFLDEGGICANDKATTIMLYEAALQLAETLSIKSLELRHHDASPISLPYHGNKVSVRLPLDVSSDDKWKSLNAKVRNQVRKATKSELTMHWEGGDKLDEFYDVFAENMRDLGSPVHSRNFFRILFREFGKDIFLLLVRKDQKVIGGGVCLKFKDRLSMPWASSLRRYRSFCPNVLMYWEAIRWGCDNRFSWFDFGRSTKGEGTYKFKMQWGSIEERLHWQRFSPSVEDGFHKTEKDKYAWLVSLWSHLPLPVTKVVGPWIRKQIPL